MTDAITSRPISKLAPLLRKREISPVELLEATLQRVHQLQPKLNSFITITEEQGRQAVVHAADEMRYGHSLKDRFET